MCRWLLLTACSIASLTLGCGSSMTAGLANAPQLGGSAVSDVRVHDAVANGSDACRGMGVGEGSALRGKFPPCPVVERSRWAVPATIVVHDPTADAVVTQWVRHFYVAWPCQGASPEPSATKAMAVASATTCGP